jgi:ATP-dependent Lhr-like helicase
MSDSALELFHPLISRWFREQVGTPTEVQEKAWPAIAEGRHVLVTAPTGCGKTLAAFLWSMHQLIIGAWKAKGAPAVLYVSPLKSLNNDVQRNVIRPLSELKLVFEGAGLPFPDIAVLTRSGDTPGEERRKMLRHPPQILITTPESLNLLLTSRGGSSLLTGISTVILDEIHAVAGTKRGTHLMTAVERLVLLSGEFQRVALSATVRPPERVAEFIGGFVRIGSDRYEPRPVTIVRSLQQKNYELNISYPAEADAGEAGGSRWPVLVRELREIIERHRSTLVFVNSRRTAERLTRLINESAGKELAYAHHGSLAREIRLAVEQKLKNGELRAIVATSSLELGIDIGELDRVVLVQTPREVSSAVQRIGRAGHSVNEKSKGTLFPMHGRDIVNAAVTTRAVLDQDIEEIRPVDAPLDLLAQIILSMTSRKRWNLDELYSFLRTSYPYRALSRKTFDRVLDMLAGRYADARVRELKARVTIDRTDNTVEARSGVAYLLYTSGGTIPERGYFDLRMRDTRAKIGELDEEFVWERRVGETFSLGAQLWKIENITHNDVEVVPARGAQGIVPFWRAEEQNRHFHLSERIGLFLERADTRLGSPGFLDELKDRHVMEDGAARELVKFLKLQKEATGSNLPHRHHLLVEHVEQPGDRGDLASVILHTGWGGRVNTPFALALAQAWEEREHRPLQIVEDDEGLLLLVLHGLRSVELFDLVTPETVESLLRRKLEQSGFFGARFRENAERALLLPKPSFKRRMPLWLIRLRSKELFGAVRKRDDFPILLETWRSCLQDEFDLDHLKQVLEEIREKRIVVTETATRNPSPFSGRLVWKQTNIAMYDDDALPQAGETALRPDLIRDVLFSAQLRPKVPVDVIRLLDQKLKRTAAGYAPDSARDLLDWIRDRVLVPEPEWKELAAAIRRDHDLDGLELLGANGEKTAWISWPGVRHPFLALLESIPRVLVAFRLLFEDLTLRPVARGGSAVSMKRSVEAVAEREAARSAEYDLPVFLSEWLSFYGPVPKQTLVHLLGVTRERLDEALVPLVEDRSVVADIITEDQAEIEICDAQNLDVLLRMTRRYRRPSFQPIPCQKLPLFFAIVHGISDPGLGQDALQQRLEQLFGWPAPARAWEEELLPARVADYRSDRLDSLMQESDLIWFGCGDRRVSLAFRQDLELFREPDEGYPGADAELDRLIPDRRGRYSFLEIAEFARLDTSRTNDLLWKEAWKGSVTSDSFRTIRKGVATRFKAQDASREYGTRSRRAGFSRWKQSRPIEGHWMRIDAPGRQRDILEEEELIRDRARQLLRRHGLLFRELIMSESQPLQWRAVFRSLRLMELSGEVLSGHFFEGIPGPQFISHEAFRLLGEPMPDSAIFWINATDPASLCGIPVDTGEALPARVPSTHLVYQGSRLVMVSKRLGRSLEIRVGPTHDTLQAFFALFKHLLTRDFNPLPRIVVESINGEGAGRSPFAPALKQFGFRQVQQRLELWKEY